MTFGLLILLALASFCTAQADTPLQGVYNPEYPPPLVQEHEPTGDEYFTDAVFVGDSMMEYVELLGEIPTANYVWKIGMSPSNMSHREFRVRGEEKKLNAYEMIARYQPRKIFIMLGANGLDWYASQYVIDDYEIMVDKLISLCPDAMIYVISAPPGSAEMMYEMNIPAARYPLFAERLQELAERRGFYFLDFYSILVDENGGLPRKYDSGDGFHLSTKAYQLLIDLVRKHTVPYPGKE